MMLNANLYNGSASITGPEIYDTVQHYTIVITASALFVILVYFILIRLGYFENSLAARQRKKKNRPSSKGKVELKKEDTNKRVKETNERYIDELKERKERLRKLNREVKSQFDKEMMIRAFNQRNRTGLNQNKPSVPQKENREELAQALLFGTATTTLYGDDENREVREYKHEASVSSGRYTPSTEQTFYYVPDSTSHHDGCGNTGDNGLGGSDCGSGGDSGGV
ncbi:hypothetical protein CN931_14480 [Bacillus sp. AFS054943]|uniref:Uncharacterized protein n=1 Tax=Bacillus cereus TaxID=1396 RepID=A0A2C1LNU3_BACCE|nr:MULTISPECIES: hypothetical protein [Bacillus]PGL82607.1 hypothetical protein CN931_14480 [Bacillus sp. AFS054943]PGT99414.1 hypothetical protein COD19_19005 [Bacillus cereus]TKI45564.1 hypothetical protein FC700_10470 [Bacillus mycoides]